MFKPIDTIKNPKAFTLVEVMVAVSIGLIGALGGYALLANIQGTVTGNSAAVQAQQEARIIVERIARELRESNPDKVWPTYMTDEESDYIVFYTPRDEDGTFIVDANGSPAWQRVITYSLDPNSNWLYRYQSYISGALASEASHYEIVSKNVERLLFSKTNGMVTISIRTFSIQEGKTGHTANSYADFYTMVKLRN